MSCTARDNTFELLTYYIHIGVNYSEDKCGQLEAALQGHLTAWTFSCMSDCHYGIYAKFGTNQGIATGVNEVLDKIWLRDLNPELVKGFNCPDY